MSRAEENAVLRVGIIGAGNMARVHVGGWRAAGDDVTHVLDHGGSRARAFAAELDAASTESLDEFMSSVDVVDICSPTDTHLGYIERAAAAGVAVVCEKPLSRTLAEATAAKETCRRAAVPLLVAHVVRFFPEYALARHEATAGDIGNVAVVRLERSTYLPGEAGSWFRDGTRSGGVVLDLMIHDVDYARWVAGDVVRVFARSAAAGNHVVATMRHISGALSHIQASWAFPRGAFRTGLEIAGSAGLIARRAVEPFVPLVSAGEDAAVVPEPPSTLAESPYVTQIKHFSDVLRNGIEPVISAADGLAAVAVCEAIAESLRSGGPILAELP